MNKFISLLDGEAKQVICAIGRNGAFYASALKALKRKLENPYTVSQLKLKNILELLSISLDNNKGLRHFRQQLKGAVTWLNSMGYVSSLKSRKQFTGNLAKYLRMSFYKKITAENFDEENINLIKLESWLGTKISSTFNPIVKLQILTQIINQLIKIH